MKLISFLIVTIFMSYTFAQESESIPPKLDKEAQFNGGSAALDQFLSDQLKFPEEAIAQGMDGTVYVGFYVEADGKLTDIRVLTGVDDFLDAEALRVVRLMPEWIPASSNGKAVKSQMTLPITFKL